MLHKITNTYLNVDTKKGVTIVFLHGNSMSSSVWRHQVASSYFKDYNVVAYDLPGNGASSKLEYYTLFTITEVIVPYLSNYDNVVLVGHSLGGHLAIELASQITNCVGLVIMGAPPLSKSLDLSAGFFFNLKAYVLFKRQLNEEELHKFCLLVSKDYQKFDYTLKDDVLKADSKFRSDFKLTLSRGEFTNQVEVVEAITYPIAIFHGVNDDYVKPEYYKKIKISNLWKGSVQLISEASHSPHLENPEEFNKMLNNFVSNLTLL